MVYDKNMNIIYAVMSDHGNDGNALICIYANRDDAVTFIRENDEDHWWYLSVYDGDTGRCLGRQDVWQE